MWKLTYKSDMTIKKHSLRNKQCTAIADYGNFNFRLF
jgi:hypothetical protein